MVHHITIQDFLSNPQDYTVIDVRSEKEYAEGHIPGAVNIPILSNEERKIVGTTYKQNGRQPAVYKGLELTGPHLTERLRLGVKHSKNGKVMVHCWRGGMRSEFFAFLLHYYGLEPNLLIGGYKSYRNSVHETFGSPLQLNVLAGKTGSGKTELLHSLKEKGEQIIDLEFLAKHRGSAFGALGFESKPSKEQFENDLSEILRTIDLKKRVWIEDENRTIGDKVIPESLWKVMLSAPRVIIERPFEDRLNRIVRDYGSFSRSDLIVSMEKIGKRLGPQHVKKAVEHLTSGEVREAFSIALGYYDKAYSFQLSKIEKNDKVFIETDGLSEEDLILKLISVKTNGN